MKVTRNGVTIAIKPDINNKKREFTCMYNDNYYMALNLTNKAKQLLKQFLDGMESEK